MREGGEGEGEGEEMKEGATKQANIVTANECRVANSRSKIAVSTAIAATYPPLIPTHS